MLYSITLFHDIYPLGRADVSEYSIVGIRNFNGNKFVNAELLLRSLINS